ncbi:TUDOR domain containing protein, partial [Trichuris trichiura]
MLIGDDTGSWKYTDLLRDKVTYSLSDQEQKCVTDTLVDEYSENRSWKLFLSDKRGDGRKARFNEVIFKPTESSGAKSGFPCLFKKEVRASTNEAKEQIGTRPKENNSGKYRNARCASYESQWSPSWQVMSSSDDEYSDDTFTDGFYKSSSKQEVTKPYEYKQVEELSEGEIVEEKDIVPYKKQDQFFTTGIGGIKFEPEVMHQVYIGHWLSPLEFHIVFATCKPLLEALEAKLQSWYSDSSEGIPFELVKKGTPCCAMNHKSIWQRAVVEGGSRCTFIRFVDSGET